MFQRSILKVFSNYMRMEANDPWGTTNAVPSGMVGKMYEGRNYTEQK